MGRFQRMGILLDIFPRICYSEKEKLRDSKKEGLLPMEIHYTPRGVCSRQIDIVVEDGIIRSVKFTGGCSGNTQGVAALARGMKVKDYLERCKGICCGSRPTSCPDQLAQALSQAVEDGSISL